MCRESDCEFELSFHRTTVNYFTQIVGELGKLVIDVR